jgi:Uncharacterized protein conserved in bacteria (DUF2252)
VSLRYPGAAVPGIPRLRVFLDGASTSKVCSENCRVKNRGRAPELFPEASAADRIAAGKALRAKVPHDVHGNAHSPPNNRDPIAQLRQADSTRIPHLVPLRYGRMLASPFAFYRGSAGVMAADLSQAPVSGVDVQVCGDAHLMNFGGFVTPERRLVDAYIEGDA